MRETYSQRWNTAPLSVFLPCRGSIICLHRGAAESACVLGCLFLAFQRSILGQKGTGGAVVCIHDCRCTFFCWLSHGPSERQKIWAISEDPAGNRTQSVIAATFDFTCLTPWGRLWQALPPLRIPVTLNNAEKKHIVLQKCFDSIDCVSRTPMCVCVPALLICQPLPKSDQSNGGSLKSHYRAGPTVRGSSSCYGGTAHWRMTTHLLHAHLTIHLTMTPPPLSASPYTLYHSVCRRSPLFVWAVTFPE